MRRNAPAQEAHERSF